MNGKSNKELYQQAFSPLRSSREIIIKKRSFTKRPAFYYGLALIFVAGCTTVTISHYDVIKSYLSWSDNASVSTVKEDDGTEGTMVIVNTDSMTAPAQVRDGRLYFTAYSENIDITDLVSVERPYIYRHEADGQVSYLVIGLNESENPANFGFAEYIETDSGLVGYSAMTNLDKDGKGLPWLENAKKELKISD